MPYVLIDSDGAVQGVSQTKVSDTGWKEVTAGSKEYLAYLDDATKQADKFRESDIQLARVLEDLIALLTERDYIKFTYFR